MKSKPYHLEHGKRIVERRLSLAEEMR